MLTNLQTLWLESTGLNSTPPFARNQLSGTPPFAHFTCLVARVYHLQSSELLYDEPLKVMWWWGWWQCKWCCKWCCKRRPAPTHFLWRAHLAHRSMGVQGADEEESARMRRFRVAARRERKRTGTSREAGGTADERGNRTARRRADMEGRVGVGQHGGRTPATRGLACVGRCSKENRHP
jgi:hypothetical protein